MSIQRERMYELLKDEKWHRTDEIVQKVYNPGAALARVAARILEVRQRLPEGWKIEGRRDKETPSLFWYRIVRPVEAQGKLFGERA